MADETPFPIVGLGASAGGLEALEAFFRATPDDPGLAFVIAAHLAPGRASLLVEILARFTRMPVEHPRNGQRIEADHIYVIQPDTVLTVEDGALHVEQLQPPQHERHPIDILFNSIAEARGEGAIGVVLSGGGSDGALGIKAIKERGGFTLAQGVDGSGPRHDGMPSAAIATGLVDLTIPVEDMPARLIAYAASIDGREDGSFERLQALEEGQLGEARDAIYAALRKQLGHDFTGYKMATFMRRVRRRMQVLQLPSLESYAERLREEPTEVRLLFRDLLIGVTSFFRDEDAFKALERNAIPRMFEGKGADDAVRVWVAGCASGEEVYSIAMLMRERMERHEAPPRVQIFATDIDEAALATARAGRYPTALLEAVSPERLSRYFVREVGSHVVSKDIRDLCVFSSHNVIRDPPFSRIDLISCRNLLIYLTAATQDRLLPVFHYALNPNGFLFLGNSENVTQHSDLFSPVDRRNRLFQRLDRRTVRIGYLTSLTGDAMARAAAGGTGQRDPANAVVSLRRAVDLRVLERFAPAHVVVNGAGEVLHFSARTGKYLEPAPGQPSQRLLEMARKGLRLDLRAALKEARETRRLTVRERVGVEIEDRVQLITLTVEPFSEATDNPLFLVLFSEVAPPLAPEQAAVYGRAPEDGDEALLRLEGELRDTRERLQSIVEEYETSAEELKSANEELVSVNEEIQSTNEELETSKEEIQSINEELQTVNAELNAKVEELDRLNADLRNLFDSNRIATIFLDRNLAIRNFTPTVSTLFNLIASDRGRPLTDIASHLVDVDLSGDVAEALRSRTTIERRVRRADSDDRFLMRVSPYRDFGDEVDGAVLTFVDVSSLSQAEERQRVMVAELNHRVRNMLAVVMGVAQHTLQGDRSASAAGEVFLGRLNALAHVYTLVSREQWRAVPLRDVLEAELAPFLLEGMERVLLDGPGVPLGPKAAVALGMAAHELSTNAAKYGALSTSAGCVEAGWRTEGDRLVMQWREVGGPPVKQGSGNGFGTSLIKRQIEYELDGAVEIDYRRDGVRVSMAIPLARLHDKSVPG
jgi:two-component system CheB/CheR fusion protein